VGDQIEARILKIDPDKRRDNYVEMDYSTLPELTYRATNTSPTRGGGMHVDEDELLTS